MKQKTKLIATLMAMCLVITLGVLGILAVKTLNMSVGGNITFTAEGINATISQGTLSTTGSWVTSSDASAKLKEVKVTTNKTETQINTELATWQGLNLLFNQNADDVTITFSVTNDATSGDPISISTSTSVATSKNATVSISPKTAIINPTKSQQFVITLAVTDKTINASLQGFEVVVGFGKTQVVDASQYESKLSFDYNETANTIAVSAKTLSGINEITIPALVKNGEKTYTVTEIAPGAFSDYDEEWPDESVGMVLSDITIPNTVTKIGKGAFCCCTITSETFTIPASVEVIEQDAFLWCSMNTLIVESEAVIIDTVYYNNLVFGENFREIPDWYLPGGDAHTVPLVKIPDYITKIGFNAFWQCFGLQKLVIGSGIVEYDETAFSGNGLQEVVIASQVIVDTLTSSSANIISHATTIKIRADLTPTEYLSGLTSGGTETIDGEVYNIYTK